MNKTLKIGTRGSRLALWQAEFTQKALQDISIASELIIIKTQGDRIQHLSLDKLEGKGFFTKELEDALLRGDIDLAVHSMKDLPTTAPEGLVTTAVSYRANPADWLIINKTALEEGQLFQLKNNATVGTSSARRKAQMKDFRPDIELKDIRGNVPTRLNKLRQGDFDAILLAAAGITRLDLDLSDFKVVQFSPKEFVPAPAQGVLAFQTCREDKATRRILKQIHDPKTSAVTNIERKVLQMLDGGCHLPLGVYCEKDEMGNYHVWAAMADSWDGEVKRIRLSQSTKHQLPERILEALTKKV